MTVMVMMMIMIMMTMMMVIMTMKTICDVINPFAPGDFAKKRILKLVEWFSGHCRAIKS